MCVLENKEPPTALEKYRGKKIGVRALVSDDETLGSLAKAGELANPALSNVFLCSA